MVEKEVLPKEKIWFVGIGKFSDIYKYGREWLVKEGYYINEDSYQEKVSGGSKDLLINWTVSKKVTDYFKFTIKINWKVLAMTDVEVEVDGKRKNLNKFAELSIELKPQLEKDYNSKWENSGTQKFFKDLYHKYIIPQRTEQKEGELLEEVQEFKEEMKALLDLTGRK